MYFYIYYNNSQITIYYIIVVHINIIPNKLKGASALRLFMEHSGNNTPPVMARITFWRCCRRAGSSKVRASAENESPEER